MSDVQDEKEKFDELNRSWQSRFDQIRTEKQEVLNQVEELKKQLAEKDNDKTLEERKLQIAAEMREKEADRKVEVYRYAAEKGIDPEHAMKALGFTEATDQERLDLLEEYQKKGRGEYIKANGRRVQESNVLQSPDYKELLTMSDDRIKKLGPAVIDRAVKKGQQEQQTTLAQKLRGHK